MITDIGFEIVDGVFYGTLSVAGVIMVRSEDPHIGPTAASDARHSARCLASACGYRTSTRLVTTLDARVVEICNACEALCDEPPCACGRTE